jgi:hypothetical protein
MLRRSPFLLVTVLTVLGVLLSLGLPNMLVTWKLGEDADDTDASVSGTSVPKRVTETSVSRVGTRPAQP